MKVDELRLEKILPKHGDKLTPAIMSEAITQLSYYMKDMALAEKWPMKSEALTESIPIACEELGFQAASSGELMRRKLSVSLSVHLAAFSGKVLSKNSRIFSVNALKFG